MGQVVRLEGWELRLDGVIENARRHPYELGMHDCFRVACAAVEALTGVDRWPEWSGKYSTKREALALIAKHGSNFEEAFDWFFDTKHVSVNLARRGDVVAFEFVGEKHLGVCTGMNCALTAESGVTFIPARRGLCAWRIG